LLSVDVFSRWFNATQTSTFSDVLFLLSVAGMFHSPVSETSRKATRFTNAACSLAGTMQIFLWNSLPTAHFKGSTSEVSITAVSDMVDILCILVSILVNIGRYQIYNLASQLRKSKDVFLNVFIWYLLVFSCKYREPHSVRLILKMPFGTSNVYY